MHAQGFPRSRKGLKVTVLREGTANDFSNRGFSSEFDEFVLYGEGVSELEWSGPAAPALALWRSQAGALRAVPADLPPLDQAAFGGNFIWSASAAFQALNPYPIPVFDNLLAGQGTDSYVFVYQSAPEEVLQQLRWGGPTLAGPSLFATLEEACQRFCAQLTSGELRADLLPQILGGRWDRLLGAHRGWVKAFLQSPAMVANRSRYKPERDWAKCPPPLARAISRRVYDDLEEAQLRILRTPPLQNVSFGPPSLVYGDWLSLGFPSAEIAPERQAAARAS